MKKISIIIVTLLCLATLTIPIFASIMPSPGAEYSFSSAFSSGNDFLAFMTGANGYIDREYDFSDLSRDKVSSMGTASVVDVARPTQYLPMTTFATSSIDIMYVLTDDMFNNDYHSGDSGYYRYRIGMYIRAYGNVTGSININANIGYVVRDSNGNVKDNGSVDGVYIPTGSSVPGVYMLFSLDFWYEQGYSIGFDIHITPGFGDSWVRFPGTTPYYLKSFLAFTPSYIDMLPINNGNLYYPDKLGKIEPYGDDLLLYDSAYEVVGSYTDPFDSSLSYVAGDSSMYFFSDTYPGIRYVYFPSYVDSKSVQHGVMYKAYAIDPKYSGNYYPNLPGGDYQDGYKAGMDQARDYYLSEIDLWKDRYDQLVSSKGNNQKMWYDKGYSDGVLSATNSINTTYSTMDRVGNLVRNCLTPLFEFGFLGITIRSLLVLCVVVVVTTFIIKKVK